MRSFIPTARVCRISNWNRTSSRNVTAKTNEWFVFPRESEGNNYSVNWSLVADGISPSKEAFHNARLPLLTSRLPNKASKGTVDDASVKFSGTFNLLEAGDSIKHEKFNESLTETTQKLSSEVLFVEDNGVVAHADSRLGVRVVTSNPAVALISRYISIPCPPREVNPRARFNGWRLDQNLGETDLAWNGKTYDYSDKAVEPGVGQRPIVAFVGAKGGDVAVQFVEHNKVISGANIVAGSDAPIRAIIEGISHSATVVLNEQNSNKLALPSVCLAKDKNTILVVGAPDELAVAAYKKNVLYGAYSNLLSNLGVSALFNGVIADSAGAESSDRVTYIASEGKTIRLVLPNNMAYPPSHIIFFEKGAKMGSISEENATAKVVALTDDKKKDIATSLISGVKLSVSGSVDEILALI